MVNKYEADAVGGFLKVLFLLAVLGIPFWIASFGLWYLFLAIPAGILIYGVGLSMVIDYVQTERYRSARKAETKKTQREARDEWLRNH